MSAHKYMADINSILNQYLPEFAQAQTLWVGFSGGLDSTVLLHALVQFPELKTKLTAIHVHHGLSVNADAWFEHCQRLCAALDIPFVGEKVTLTDLKDGIEQAARQARYQTYKQHTQAGDCLLLAHHADDQIETFMLRLTRGSGLQGLMGMAAQRPLKPSVSLMRPLLALTRFDLEAYAAHHQLTWVEDESNQDSQYERNWWRNELLPQIWQQFPQRKAVVLRTLNQLTQDQQLLTELLAPSVAKVCEPWPWPSCAAVACNLSQLQELPRQQRSYVLKAWLSQLELPVPSTGWLHELERIISAAVDRQPSLQIGQYCIQRHKQSLYVQIPTFEPLVQSLNLTETKAHCLAWAGGSLIAQYGEGGLRSGVYQLLPAMAVRGHTLKMAGRPHKTLKHLFQEANVPASLRAHWPVLMSGAELITVVGLAVADTYYQAQAWRLTWR